jgi:uncharacterized protein
MRWMQWIVAGALGLCSTSGFTAGFDCASAKTSAEGRICANHELSHLDGELAETYRTALRTAEGPSKADLKREQRHWITFVRDVCDSDACLTTAYVERIKLLAENQRVLINESSCEIPEGTSCRSVITYRDTSYRIASFNRSLSDHHVPGAIVGCDRLIDLPVGLRDSNHSFGAFCTLQSDAGRKRVKVCNDDMVGRFAIEPVSTGTYAELRDFTDARCFGG